MEYHHTVNDLIRAANKMLRRTKRRLPPPVTSFQGIVGREPAPVEGRVTAILKRFLYRMRVPFMRLFDDARNRSEIVATFWLCWNYPRPAESVWKGTARRWS